MKRIARHFLVTALGLGAIGASAPLAAQQGPIRIGEINSYTGPMALFGDTYRKGMELAVEHINAGGGVLGRKLELVIRDDNLSAADAVRHAGELVNNQKVDVLAGTFLSGIGMAVANFAQQNKVLFVATEPLTNQITWERGSRYVFRVSPPVLGAAAAMAQRAANLKCTRWAGVGPISEAITDLHNDFKRFLTARNVSFTWVGEVLNPMGKANSGATIDALERMKADCVISTLIGPDLVSYLRESKIRGALKSITHLGMQQGSPEWLRQLGPEAPVGWIVTGYPWQFIDTPAHKKMIAEYQSKYKADPGLGTITGYVAIEAIAAGIRSAKATDVESLIKGFRTAQFQSVIGPMKWRRDHQLEYGVWMGRLEIEPGATTAVMKDYVYLGKDSLPSEEEGLKRRPAGAND